MRVPTQAVFYRTFDGREPVREFLDSTLTPGEHDIVGNQIDEMNGLQDNVPPLPFPRTSQLDGALRELRCHNGRALYRILYRRSGNLFVLLHVFRKNSKTVPKRDVELAQRRWRDFTRRMNTSKRRGPRPAGRDAP
jgi:phage-related protein